MKKLVMMLTLALGLGSVAVAQTPAKQADKAKTEKACCKKEAKADKKACDTKDAKADKKIDTREVKPEHRAKAKACCKKKADKPAEAKK